MLRHQKNRGLGGARNTAIRAARAEYLASIDSDDYADPKMLETLWNAAEKGNHDVVVCGYHRVGKNGKIRSSYEPGTRVVQNESHSANIFRVANPSFWNKLWKKSLFLYNDIYFPEKVYFEDLATTPRLFAKCHSIKVISLPLYFYRLRPTSITTTTSEKHLLDYVRVFEILREFLVNENLQERYHDEFLDAVSGNFGFHARNIAKSRRSDDDKSAYLRLLLLIRLAYFEYMEQLPAAGPEHLLALATSARTREDLNTPE